MSKKCVAFSKSKLGLETADNRKSFYAGWDAALAEQAEQEPVGWAHPSGEYLSARYMKWFATGLEKETYTIPLYAAPVRTKDLTDDEIDAFIDRAWDKQMSMPEIIRAVIAADREKNRG